MSWAKIDDHLFCHPKMLTVSLAARGLWITALSYAAGLERDGWFPFSGLALLARSDVDLDPLAHELVHAALWSREADGYRIHDYLRYNPSAKQLQKLRKRDAARQRASRMRHAWSHGVTPDGVTRPCHSVPARPGPTRPSPRQLSLATLAQGSASPSRFPEFWIAYPKKRHRPAAERAWTRVAGDMITPSILGGLERWTASPQWLAGRIEDPATFLNQRQWEDPVPPAAGPDDRGDSAEAIAARLQARAAKDGGGP